MSTAAPIICTDLPPIKAMELDAVIHAFHSAPAFAMRQSWLAEPEPGFAPAVVRVGWHNESLLALAEMKDADIFTLARHPNDRLWELGDTLEIFLRPVEQLAYAEFHVAPNNQRVRLRFASPAATEHLRGNGWFNRALSQEDGFDSWTWVCPDINCWYALVEIPVSSVSDRPQPLPGSKWLFSFSRYDHTRGNAKPVISSTSAHARPDFHRQEEWGTLHFQLRLPALQPGRQATLSARAGNHHGGLEPIT